MTKNLQLLDEHGTGPISILAVQSPVTIEKGGLQKLLAEDSGEVSDAAIAQVVKHAEDYASVSIRSSLGRQLQIKLEDGRGLKWSSRNALELAHGRGNSFTSTEDSLTGISIKEPLINSWTRILNPKFATAALQILVIGRL